MSWLFLWWRLSEKRNDLPAGEVEGDARGEWAGYVYRRSTTIERATEVLLIARDSATDPAD
jgi:hypothetical protein